MLSAIWKLAMTPRSICLPDFLAVSHLRRYSRRVSAVCFERRTYLFFLPSARANFFRRFRTAFSSFLIFLCNSKSFASHSLAPDFYSGGASVFPRSGRGETRQNVDRSQRRKAAPLPCRISTYGFERTSPNGNLTPFAFLRQRRHRFASGLEVRGASGICFGDAGLRASASG
jgi:hypothetical protein